MTRFGVGDRLAGLDEDGRRACIESVAARTRNPPVTDLGLDSDVLFAVARR